MASVQLKNLEKVYGGSFKAVHGINLEIEDGEFMVFVGPSGCAKSTTLRMVAGLEEITGGEILIGDQRVNDLPPGKRSIAMVFQNYALYPHMKVRGNLAFGLKIAGVAKPEIEKAIDNVARILEIEPLLDRLPKQLSGGQAQRGARPKATRCACPPESCFGRRSGLLGAGRSSRNRACSCSMSPFRISMRSCALPCVCALPICIAS